MKRVIDFGDKKYLDLPMEKFGINIRIWPNNLSDGTHNWHPTEGIEEHWNMDQLFKINDRLTGLFYLSNGKPIHDK